MKKEIWIDIEDKLWSICKDLRPTIIYNIHFMKEKIEIPILHYDTHRKDTNLYWKDLSTLVNTKEYLYMKKKIDEKKYKWIIEWNLKKLYLRIVYVLILLGTISSITKWL